MMFFRRVGEFLSSRLSWVAPTPLPQTSVCPPLGPGGAKLGVGGTQFRRLDRNFGTLYSIIPFRMEASPGAWNSFMDA